MRRSKPTLRDLLDQLWRDAAKNKLREEILRYRPRMVTIGPMQVFHMRDIAAELTDLEYEFSWFVDHDCHDYSWVFDNPEHMKHL